MLDILRKHAQSWLIKLPIIVIILSFAFFFGYSAMRSGPESEQAIVATVNGQPVSTPEFKYYLDNTYERLRQNFKDQQIPDFVEQMAMSTALRQIISRELMLMEADKLGITIPNVELANIIRKDQSLLQGGKFDTMFYRRKFLPHFKNRYGIDYEEFVRRDLKLESLNSIFVNIDGKPTFSPEDEGSGFMDSWTFGVVEIEPQKLVEAKIIDEEAAANKIAVDLISTPPSKWKWTLKKNKLEEKNTGPITISERSVIFGPKAPMENLNIVFQLTEEEPVVKKPIRHEDKIYVIRLVEKKRLDEAKKPRPTSPFFQMWMSKMLADSKVETFLEKKQ